MYNDFYNSWSDDKGGIIMHKHILQYSHLNERGDIIGQESGAYGVCCKCFRINIMFV